MHGHLNGSLHIGSGIPDHALHLAARAMGGNAWEAAGHAWHEVPTTRLKAGSELVDAARGTVAHAWSAVGVTT